METLVLKTVTVLFSSAVVAGILLPKFMKYSLKKQWIVISSKSTSHAKRIPTSGGMIFIPVIAISLIISNWSTENSILHFLLILIGFIGFSHDRSNLSTLLKLVIEAMMVLLIFLIGIDTSTLESILGFSNLSVLFKLFFTFIVIYFLINAFIRIDRFDGLIGGISLINTLLFAGIFYFHGNTEMCLLHLAFSVALIVFLTLNFNPAKVFMGNAGSLMIGFLMGFSFLMILQYEHSLTSTLAFTMMIFPSMEMLRHIVSTLLNQRSFFSSDKNHCHHLLLKMNHNRKHAVLMSYSLHATIIGVGVLFLNWFSFVQANFIVLTSSVIVYLIIEVRFLIIQRKQYKIITELLRKTARNKQLLKA